MVLTGAVTRKDIKAKYFADNIIFGELYMHQEFEAVVSVSIFPGSPVP